MPVFAGNNWKIEVLDDGLFWQDRLRSHTKADVYLFNTPVLPLFFRPKKSIVIAQDFPYLFLSSNSFKEWVFLRFVRWYHGFSLRRADAIVAISEATQQDVVHYFGIPEEKITVIYQGFKRICIVPEEQIDIPEKFFLSVGAIKERKNTLATIRAYALFRERNTNTPYALPYALVLGGRSDEVYVKKVKQYIQDVGIEQYIYFLGHLNDGMLSFVYKKAEALIFPSSIEGFGLPVVEAMDCGLPVITSNRGGPRELGRDGAALLVDPSRYEEITDAMERMIHDSGAKSRLIDRGHARAQEITWERAAREMLRVMQNL